MAYGVTLSASMGYSDSEGSEETRSLSDLLAAVATKKYVKAKQNVGTSEEALVLGEVTAPRWCLIINLDETNFVNVKVATSGAVFAKLKPGEFCLLPLGSGAQAPFVQSDTAACQIELFVAST